MVVAQMPSLAELIGLRDPLTGAQYQPGPSPWGRSPFLSGLAGAAALPGDVYAGRVNPMSDEGIQKALGIASLMGLNATGAPRGALGAGPVFRGTETGGNPLRSFREGDLGTGIYYTPSERLAASYGGGPTASVSKGTRQVHERFLEDALPEETVYLHGGRKYGEPVQLIDGNGNKIWEGDWKGANIDAALKEMNPRVVIGAPGSIGEGQIAIRDPSLLR